MENLITAVSAVLATTPGRWLALTAHLPADLLSLPPATGEWSTADCLLHLLDTERYVFPVRVRAFLGGQDFPAFNPDLEGTPAGSLTPAAMAAEFASLRRPALEQLARLSLADLQRSAVHAELGPVTLGEMLHEWAAHDLMHTVQAERALMQPFIRGSGAWLPYFKDHVAI